MEAFFVFVLLLGLVVLLVRQSTQGRRIRAIEQYLRQQAAAKPAAQAPIQPPSAPPPPAAQHAPPPATAPLRATYIPPPPPAAPIPQVAALKATGFDPSVPPPSAPQASATEEAPAAPKLAAKPRASLEARLGQNWLNKLGIVSVVLGVALGLGLVVHNLGPLGKSLIGLAVALAILGLGLLLERRPNYRLFARTCIGGGWSLLFFLSFAVYHLPSLQIVTSTTADLVLMLVVAAGMVAHSLRYRSQTVTTVAFLLAFLTLAISHVTVFSLVAGALLTAALAVIVARERWYWLALAGLVGVYLNHFLWLRELLQKNSGAMGYQAAVPGNHFPEFLPSAALLVAYWVIFRLVYVLRPPLPGASHQEQQTVAGLTAVLNSGALLALLRYQSANSDWAFPALLTLGLVEFGLSLYARSSTVTRPANRPGFIVLSTLAAMIVLASIPFRYHGPGWSLLWVLEAEALFVAGVRLPERFFRRLGTIILLITSAGLCFTSMLVLSFGRELFHLRTSVFAIGLTALVLWLNAEYATRRWPAVTGRGFDRYALRLSSYVAALLATLGFTILVGSGSALLGVTWMMLALFLAAIADRLHAADASLGSPDSARGSFDLATQSDLIALAAVLRTLTDNLWIDPLKPYTLLGEHMSLQALSVGVTAALLYLAMRRRTPAHVLPKRLIAPVYSWTATALVAALLWFQLQPVMVAVAWSVLALALFETGLWSRRVYLRHQAYALLAASFVRIFFANLHVPHDPNTIDPGLYTVIPLIAIYSWVYERTHRSAEATAFDKAAGALTDCLGVAAAAVLIFWQLRPDWIVLGWALLTLAVLAFAAALKRTLFVAQSLAMLAATVVCALVVNVADARPIATGLYTSRAFTVGLTSALLLLALPLAFQLRRYYLNLSCHPEERSDEGSASPERHGLLTLLHHPVLQRPEQPFFFAPLLLLTLLALIELHGAVITIGWVALGLAAFLFALAVRQRSYRLSGLGLLLLGVAKVVLWDVWHATATERTLALIVLGVALLLVSFLYSRYRETLLKFL